MPISSDITLASQQTKVIHSAHSIETLFRFFRKYFTIRCGAFFAFARLWGIDAAPTCAPMGYNCVFERARKLCLMYGCVWTWKKKERQPCVMRESLMLFFFVVGGVIAAWWLRKYRAFDRCVFCAHGAHPPTR